MFRKLVILIPTRNRGKLACRSAISVIKSQTRFPVDVIISDNSTDAGESAIIDAFLAEHTSHGVSLIRPSRPLPMTEHWQWAISRAMTIHDASHFFVLTDRMLFKNEALSHLLAITEKYPDELISFTYDRIDDYSRPISYLPLPRTGQLYRMDTRHLLRLSANMVFYSCFPRMLNCVAPRSVLEKMERKYGSVFASVSPDYCFCFKVLGLIPTMLYYDNSALVNYASDRSNGASFSRGIITKDSADFEQNLTMSTLNSEAPVPGIRTVGNAVINEYCSVKKQSDADSYPEIALRPYLDFLAAEVAGFLDPKAVSSANEVLAEKGWRATIGFKIRLLKGKLSLWLLSMRKRKFDALDEAVRYATMHPTKNRPWFGRINRRYGKQILPLPWI